ncbi:MAG: sialate O-acetylesterase [Phycisphaerales bacterium]
MSKFMFVRNIKYVFFGLLLSFGAETLANVSLPKIFGNGMVLQQGMELPFWGWADPNETITVAIGNNETQTIANSKGEWKIKLSKMSAGGPVEVLIKGNNTIVLKDVLIGEVWICSGQSNMEMGIDVVKNGKQEIAEANYSKIRLFKTQRIASGLPLQDFANHGEEYETWHVCNSKNISTGGWGGFSAVAYFYGRELHKKLNVPVGLIDTSWGGTRIEPWTPPVGFGQVSQLNSYVKEIEQKNNEYNQAVPDALIKLKSWINEAQTTVAKEGTINAPPWPRHALAKPEAPTGLYNAMINPLVPFAIRGAIWYQGEGNCGEGMLYYEKMKSLIGGWRTVWQQGDFPFYFVQLAPFRYSQGENLPWIWQAQLTSLSIPNTGMAVITDLVDDTMNIHPVNKQDVGKRLALWALAKDYGRKEIIYSGPLYREMSIEGGSIRIFFDGVGSGLTTRDGNAPDFFEIAGADMKYMKANAKIENNTVVVTNTEIKNPIAVRFGWNELAMPNLMNKEGLPASPFISEIK